MILLSTERGKVARLESDHRERMKVVVTNAAEKCSQALSGKITAWVTEHISRIDAELTNVVDRNIDEHDLLLGGRGTLLMLVRDVLGKQVTITTTISDRVA